MDFTIKEYIRLLDSLISQHYTFQTFDEILRNPALRSIVLRHDVDLLPEHSLRFAKIQHERNIKGVYYFRAVSESWNENIIKEIASLGHEVGYHYECLTTANGDLEKGIADFEKNLSALRKLVPVATICMHGSPMSKYDSKDLWKKHDYRTYGIIGEPYFDLDFNKMFYLTDTGRRWDGDKMSVRDKVNSAIKLKFHSTGQIIEAANQGKMPDKIMFTFHPQRWNDNILAWFKELCLQNAKNVIKRFIYVRTRSKNDS